jgi:hypothetical protein
MPRQSEVRNAVFPSFQTSGANRIAGDADRPPTFQATFDLKTDQDTDEIRLLMTGALRLPGSGAATAAMTRPPDAGRLAAEHRQR